MTQFPAPVPPPPIELCAASVRLGGKEILAPLTLSLSETRIAVIGRNGSGKSTFLRLIAGLTPPATGHVRAGGDDLSQNRRAALARVGILFQNPEHQILFPTVLEELSFGLTQMGQSRAAANKAARAALDARGRAHWADAPIAQLSGGQKQYLCLLSVLLMTPETLLLDEPFASLDAPATLRLKRELAGLSGRQILITHRPEDAAACGRVIWLESGRVQQDGPPDEVLPAFEAAMETLARRDADTDLTF